MIWADVFPSAADNLVALGIAALCVAYLVFVLVFPERF